MQRETQQQNQARVVDQLEEDKERLYRQKVGFMERPELQLFRKQFRNNFQRDPVFAGSMARWSSKH